MIRRLAALAAAVLGLAALPGTDVVRVVPDRAYPPAEPVRTAPAAPPDGVEWNVARLRGQGVVVGTIDTGAQFDHPALRVPTDRT